MDIGSMLIQVVDGTPRVVRYEPGDPVGTRLVAATNTTDLVDTARDSLLNLGVAEPFADGLYPCAQELKRQAVWPPLILPDDPIILAEARTILYPDLKPKVAWTKVHRLVRAEKLRAYAIGIDRPRIVVSRAAVVQLAQGALVAASQND